MSEFKYTVSFFAPTPFTKIIKPEWWRFWEKTFCIEGSSYERYVLFVTEAEYKELFKRQNKGDSMWAILFRALANVDESNTTHIIVVMIHPSILTSISLSAAIYSSSKRPIAAFVVAASPPLLRELRARRHFIARG